MQQFIASYKALFPEASAEEQKNAWSEERDREAAEKQAERAAAAAEKHAERVLSIMNSDWLAADKAIALSTLVAVHPQKGTY